MIRVGSTYENPFTGLNDPEPKKETMNAFYVDVGWNILTKLLI